MRRRSLSALVILLAAVGCGNGSTNGNAGGDDSTGEGDNASTGSGPATATTPVPGPGGTPPASVADAGTAPGAAEAGASLLSMRVLDYGSALRTASLKLVGDLPTLAQIKAIGNAKDPASVYAADIDAMLADPRFATQMIQYFRDTFKTGDQGQQGKNGLPDFDTAANFAAMTVVNGAPYTDLLTATTGTCPTYAGGKFTTASCTNGATTAGVLTDPGLMAQYFVPMAFRRIRFVQEIFVCSPFPAEYSAKPVPKGQSLYTSPWPFTSIAGPNAPINFQDTSAIICANCHTTLNHMAPLFGYFDVNGKYVSGTFQVQTPVAPPVTSQLTDWLPATEEKFAWRDGTPVTDITSLAKAIAADPDIPTCAVNRVWDWAFNRGDIVNNLATVPEDVTASYVQTFTKNKMNLQSVIKAIYTSDDFVNF